MDILKNLECIIILFLNFRSKEKEKLEIWKDYFIQNGFNFSMVVEPSIAKLVKVGIPGRLRGELWELFSGSIYYRFNNPDFYNNLTKVNNNKNSLATEEIEKDLNRYILNLF